MRKRNLGIQISGQNEWKIILHENYPKNLPMLICKENKLNIPLVPGNILRFPLTCRRKPYYKIKDTYWNKKAVAFEGSSFSSDH